MAVEVRVVNTEDFIAEHGGPPKLPGNAKVKVKETA